MRLLSAAAGQGPAADAAWLLIACIDVCSPLQVQVGLLWLFRCCLYACLQPVVLAIGQAVVAWVLAVLLHWVGLLSKTMESTMERVPLICPLDGRMEHQGVGVS